MTSSPRRENAEGKVGHTGSGKRESVLEKIDVGARVRVLNTNVKTEESDALVVGTVHFVGATSFADGSWVGIELDAPLGKNDGSVQGIQYFQCQAGHGIFVRRKAVKLLEANVETSSSSTTTEEKKSPSRPAGKSARRFSMMEMPAPAPVKRGFEPEEEDTLAPISHVMRDRVSVMANAVDEEEENQGVIDYWKSVADKTAEEVVNGSEGLGADKTESGAALKEMGDKVRSMMDPKGKYAASLDSCSDTESDVVVEEPALQAFRQAAQCAVEEGTRGLFEAVLQFHRALADQSYNIEKLQGTVTQLRRDLAARDKRPQARESNVSPASPSRSTKARSSIAPAAQETLTASPQSWQPVEVCGVSGKNSERLNGIYRPTPTVINRCTAFEKDGDRDTWFCFDSQHSRWKVQRETARGSDRGWLSSQRTDAPHPVVEGAWNVWTGSEWEVQSSVVVKFTQDRGWDNTRGGSGVAGGGPQAAEQANEPAQRPTPVSPAAKRSARRGSTLDLSACLERSGATADGPGSPPQAPQSPQSPQAPQAPQEPEVDVVPSFMRGVYKRCSTMQGAGDGATAAALAPTGEQLQAASAGIAAAAAAEGRELYVDDVSKLTEMYVRNLTEFSEKRLQLNRVYQDARENSLDEVVWGSAEVAKTSSESV